MHCALTQVPLPLATEAGKSGRGKRGRQDKKDGLGVAAEAEAPQVVTAKNRGQYVDLYARRRYCPPGMQASVQAIRQGLLRVRLWACLCVCEMHLPNLSSVLRMTGDSSTPN